MSRAEVRTLSAQAAERMIPELTREVAPSRNEPAVDRFDTLYLRHYARVMSIFLRLTNDHAHADELTNDVFASLHRRRSVLLEDSDDDIAGWLYRTAVNHGIDALRKSNRRTRYERSAAAENGHSDPSPDPLAGVLASEKRARVQSALAKLKPAQARILVLRASGLSYGELAASLEVAPGSVGTLLARAEAAFEKVYRLLFPSEET